MRKRCALVVQRIERGPAKAEIEVQFLASAPDKLLKKKVGGG